MRYRVGLDVSALDPSFKEHAARGIGRYVRELSKRLAENTSHPSVSIGTFDHRDFRAGPVLEGAIRKLPAGRETIRQQIVYPLKLGNATRPRFDFLHFPAHMDAPSWSPMPYLLTVLDLIPLVCRDLYERDRPTWRFRFARWLELRAMKNASLILAISQQTASDVERIVGIPAERIVVTPLGVDPKFFAPAVAFSEAEVRSKFGIPQARQVVLYVGGIDQRKNCEGMLEAFSHLCQHRSERGAVRPVLVMAGRITQDLQFPRLQNKIQTLGLNQDICMPGFVEDSLLISLYRMSAAFIFLSLYEGFGLTPLEAMAAGVPVVSSNTSAMPEVLENGACLVDPTNASAAAEKLLAILDNPSFAQQLRERGRSQAARFTWERTAQCTLDAYQRFGAQYRGNQGPMPIQEVT